jgi:Na+/H+-dicarboxylate symporter
MQLYTQILIGMLIGVVIGLGFGPNALLLEHDQYSFNQASRAHVYLTPDQSTSQLKLGDSKLNLKLIEYKEEEVADKKGKKHLLPTWAKVELKLSSKMLLGQKGDHLKTQLMAHFKQQGQTISKIKKGQRLDVWLKLSHTYLDEGGIVVIEKPVSSIGQTLLGFLGPIGDLFMRLLKMVIVPLVFSSLLVGVAGLGDVRKLGRLGGRTIGLYICTTAVAVGLGLLASHLFSPGSDRFIDPEAKTRLLSEFQASASSKADHAASAPSMMENLLNIVPTNPMGALADGNMLQIIFFALFLGIALTMLKEKGETLIRFFDDLQEAMVVVINLVMKFAPFGVAALVAAVIGQSGWTVLQALLVYSITVLVGLALHAVLVYGSLVKFVAKIPLTQFFKAIRPAQMLAFSTSSSSATLPVSMECAEKNIKMSKEVASFVLPLGSTVNMDGTALYQGVAAIFIAQVFEIDLSLADQLSIVLAATMASIGAAGVPGAGIVTLALVLTASGIPQVGLALILGMDRLLDMFRTAVNVTGDLSVATVMAHLEGESLMSSDETLPIESKEESKEEA